MSRSRSVGALLHHWQGATKRAGCKGRIIHDLRRTAAQAFVDAGVDEQTIMDLFGVATRSIFTRYLIVRQQRLDRAVGARFKRLASSSRSGFLPLSRAEPTPETAAASPGSWPPTPCAAHRRSS